jgi:putative SOS response-associated peptidase YedK
MPHWTKDINVGFAHINARAEGIETQPAFGDAFERWPCLVPVDSFYGCQKGGNRQAALCDCANGRAPNGPGRIVGELALAGWRVGAAASRS